MKGLGVLKTAVSKYSCEVKRGRMKLRDSEW